MTKRSKRQQRIKQDSLVLRPTRGEVPESSVGYRIEKEPRLIPSKIFRSLLSLSLRLLPEERGVVLSISNHITLRKKCILYCLNFVNNRFVQPIGVFWMKLEDNFPTEYVVELWISLIQDISLLNLRVIASISNPSYRYFQAIQLLMKCQITFGQLNDLTYCIMPYKEIVHFFCIQSTMSAFLLTFRSKPHLYYISADDYADGERFKVVHASYVDGVEASHMTNIRYSFELLERSLKTALTKCKIKEQSDATNATYKVCVMLSTFAEMMSNMQNLTSEKVLQILTENRDLFRMLLSVKLLPNEMEELPGYSGPVFDLYDPYIELVKSRLINHSVENNHPVEPYYLLKEEAVPYFTKPSACLGKRTESDKRRLIEFMKQHWSNRRLHKLETKPQHIPHRVEIVKESRSINQSIDFIKTLVEKNNESAFSKDITDPDSVLPDQSSTSEFNYEKTLEDLMNNNQADISMTDLKKVLELNQKTEQMGYETARSIAVELVNNVFVVVDKTSNLIGTKEMDISKQQREREQYNFLFNKMYAVTNTDASVTYFLHNLMGFNKLGEILKYYQIKSIDSHILCLDRVVHCERYFQNKKLSSFLTDLFHLVDPKATLEELTWQE